MPQKSARNPQPLKSNITNTVLGMSAKIKNESKGVSRTFGQVAGTAPCPSPLVVILPRMVEGG